MGIDRPDEDEAREVERHSPDAPRETSTDRRDPPAQVEPDDGTDLKAVQAAYNVAYRAAVEATYWASPDSWDEGVLVLRDAWAKLERTYPHTEQSQPTLEHEDGSWYGEGDRYLNPRENSEVTLGREGIKEIGETSILPAMHRIEIEDPERRLVGLDRWLKGEDRLKEKIADRLRLQPELTASQALAEVPDAVRFTFAYSEKHYAEGVHADIERLKAEGFELIKLKNLWASDQYKGINSQWRSLESGLLVEVQFHTQASFEAKQLTHKAYERIRSPATSVDEEHALKSYQRRVCDMIPDVPDVAEIENHPPERRDA